MSQFLHIGFKSYVPIGRIAGLINLQQGSSPIKRFIDAKDDSLFLDCTRGRPRKTMILLDSGQIILSPIGSEALSNRVNGDMDE